MKNNNIEKKAKEHVEDFLDGVYNTVVGVPVAFGDFIGRVSGFRDWQNEGIIDLKNIEQNQALLEVRILYEAFNHEASRDIIKKALVEDFEERPAYYVGGMGIQAGLATTLSKISKIGYSTTMTNTKIESVINEKYNTVKKISQLEDENFNILTENILSTVNWFDNFEENINIYKEENKDVKYHLIEENGTESFIDIPRDKEEVQTVVDEKLNDYGLTDEDMEWLTVSNEEVEQIAKENERPITTYLNDIKDQNDSGRSLVDDYDRMD